MPRTTTANRRALRAAAPALVISALLAGCQSYTPRPLDPAATREAWQSRSPDDEQVRDFAARLAAAETSDEPPAFDPADGLSLAEGEAVALVFNRELRLARLEAGITLADLQHAGLWDDPSLSLDLERILTGIPDPWVIGAAIGLTLPISGRLTAEIARADAVHRAQLHRLAAAEWSTRTALSEQWIQWSAQVQRASLAHQLAEQLRAIADLAAKQERAGTLSRIESRHFAVQLAIQQASATASEAEAHERKLRLLDTLGLAPGAPVEFIERLTFTPPDISDKPLAQLETRNPELAAQHAAYTAAEESLRLEIRRQYPDFAIGPGFATDEGDERLTLGLGITLPIWNRNRQAIARANAERDAARARYESTYESLASQLAIAQSRSAAAQKQRTTIEESIVPLADEQESEVRRAAQLGRIDPWLLAESLHNQHEAKLQLIESREGEALAAIRLRHLLGPPTPLSPPSPPSPSSPPSPAPSEGDHQ